MAVVFGGAVLETVAVSIVIMAGAVALIHMFAQFLKRPEWEAYANLELYQVFYSVLLLVVVLFAANLAIETSHRIYGMGYFDIVDEYLSKVITQLTIPALIQMEGIVLNMQWWGGMQVHYGAGSAWSYRFPLFPWASLIESVFELLLVLMSPFTASIMAQYFGMQIIKATMMTFVLPAGIVLRTFPQTRDAGIFLVATSLGFYFIFPLTFVMHYEILKVMDKEDGVLDFVSGTNNPGAKNWLLEYVAGLSDEKRGAYDKIWSTTALKWDMVFSPFAYLSMLIMQAIFLPGFSLMLTVTFIKSMLKFLGQKMG